MSNHGLSCWLAAAVRVVSCRAPLWRRRERGIPLSGTWSAIADKENSGERQRTRPKPWCLRLAGCAGAGTFGAINDSLETYVGTCWFRRIFTVPEAWRGKRVALHFDGLGNQAKVWVNGQLVGGVNDPYLPCDLLVGDALRYSEENTVAVSVNNEHPHSGVPTNFYWRADGGILRNVELRATDHLVLGSVKVEARPLPSGAGSFLLRATVENGRMVPASASIRVTVVDRAGKQLRSLVPQTLELAPQKEGELEIAAELPNVQPWTPDSPTLYSASVELAEAGDVLAARDIRFGFRTVEVRGVQVLLNGKPMYLFGFNRHEDTFRDGMALDPATVERDLRDIKRMGANFVRLCHYPHDTATLDWCDELGLLVMCEIPFLGCSLDRRGPENRPIETRLVSETTARQNGHNGPPGLEPPVGHLLVDGQRERRERPPSARFTPTWRS